MARTGRGFPAHALFIKPGSYSFQPSSGDVGGGDDIERSIGVIAVPTLAAPITITPSGYDSLSLVWTNPSDSWTNMKLVRSSFGYPTTIYEGTTLFTRTADEAVPYYDDNSGLRPGRFYYYSLFVESGAYGWWRAGVASSLITKDFDTRGLWWDLTPTWYRQADDDQAEEAGPLRRLYELLGYEHDRLRTEVETLGTLGDIDFVSGDLLPYFAAQFGIDYEPAIGMRQNRVLLKNAIYLAKMKGTKLGIEGMASAVTSYGADAVVGINLMLTRDDAEAYLSVGQWAATTNLTRARVTSPTPQAGVGILRMTAAGAGNMASNCGSTGAKGIPVIVGTNYCFSAYIRTAVSARTAKVKIIWYNAAGGVISTTTGADITDASGSWTRAYATAAAPALAVTAVPVVQVDSAGGAAEIHYACAMLFEKAATPSTWESSRVIKVYLQPSRINLVTNPSAETNTTGIYNYLNAVVARVNTVTAESGSWEFRMTAAGSGNQALATGDNASAAATGSAVDADSTYTASAYFRPAATVRNCKVIIRWYTSGGVFLSQDTGTAVANVVGSWTRASVTANAPATAAFAIVVAQADGCANAEVQYVDAILLEEAAALSDYFDASLVPTDDYYWEGTTHNSRSFYYPLRYPRSQRLTALLPDYIPYDAQATTVYGTTTIPASSI